MFFTFSKEGKRFGFNFNDVVLFEEVTVNDVTRVDVLLNVPYAETNYKGDAKQNTTSRKFHTQVHVSIPSEFSEAFFKTVDSMGTVPVEKPKKVKP